jgi:adenylylsulfate kinase
MKSTTTSSDPAGFAIWITGLPASGKTATARELRKMLQENYNIRCASLESDALRRVLTPEPSYSLKERDWFYSVLLFIGELLIKNGVNVLFDATANRRAYRDHARQSLGRFLEVYIRCPLEVCMARDPKGIYRKASMGETATAPGVQDVYEEPLSPEVIIDSDKVGPQKGAERIVEKMKQLEWL